MKKSKIIIYASLIFFALVVFGVSLFLFLRYENSPEENMRGLPVYFFNAAQGGLQAEYRELPHGDSSARIDAALRYFFGTPENSSLARTWPSEIAFLDFVTDIFLEDGILVTTFSEHYDEMPPIDEVLFRAAFTLTMTGLPYIDGIMFRANENEFFETAETIANNPYISPARRTAEDITLFFVDETGEGLVTEVYSAADVNVHTRAQEILEKLIERQNAQGILPLIPAETRVRDVLIELDGGIYVDLSPEFHSRFSGNATHAYLMLQSITHTMLENIPGPPRRVFFLIDSERWEDFHGVNDFNLGFTIDETIMLGALEE
jgi:germination protein M